MELAAARQSLLETLRKAENRLKAFLAILRAVLHAGIPTRFFILIFAVGVIGGFFLKMLALESFTIGHDDYRLVPKARLYDLNVVQKEALSEGATLTEPKKTGNYPSDPIDTAELK